MRTKFLIQTALAATLASALSLSAGTFTANFNDGLVPPGTAVSGSAAVESDGGVGNSGALKLTKAVNGLTGSFIINDLDPGVADGVNSLAVDFKLRMGGGTTPPADGFSFAMGPDVTGTFGEDGAGTGLIVSFDTYDNVDSNPDNGTGEAPAIEVRLGATTVASVLYPNTSFLLTGGDYANVHIQLDPDGTLDVVYKNTIIFTNLDLVAFGFRPFAAAQYGFGARTGGLNANHFVDDLSIVTGTGQLQTAFNVQPRSLTALAGSSVTLRSQVNDPLSVFSYQWARKDPGSSTFTDIPGALGSTYTTAPLTVADSGAQFRVTAVGNFNDAVSEVATINVVTLALPAPGLSLDFNDGAVPPNTAVYGSATVTATGGVGDSGVLRLTEPANDQNGAFIVNDLNGGAVVGSMTATFDLQLGPGTTPPADGFSFNWASDLPNATATTAEEGAGTGLTVSFDAYDNGGGEAPSIDIKWRGVTVASRKLRTNDLSLAMFVPVVIRLERDGTVDVAYAGELIHSNIMVSGFAGLAGGRFGFAARTGGANEGHYVDNIHLTTEVCTDCLLAFVRQPADTAVLVGSNAMFSAEVNAPATATYQWQVRAPGSSTFVDVPGATSAAYVTPFLTTGDDQSAYRLVVNGPLNSITSRVAVATVVNLSRPTADLDVDYNFNDAATPPETQLFGNAAITPTGGVGDSGVLHLTDEVNSQTGAFLINRVFEGGNAVASFTAAFDARVDGGTPAPADGYSFNWAADLPADVYPTPEEGAGTGLTVSFDVWDSGGGEAPAITLKWRGQVVTNRNVSLDVIRTATNSFEEVLIGLDPDGTVDVAYGGELILRNVALPNFVPLANAKFGFAARTGGANENHWIDNISIQTRRATTPPVLLTQPADQVVLAGTNTVLSVRVNDPLAVTSYQWQQRAPGTEEFVDIPGATSPDLTTPTLGLPDSGIQYRVLLAISSPAVTLTSRVATITVVDIPLPTPTVSFDFDSGALPAGTALFGSAVIDTAGGVGGTGAIKLTANVNDQVGSFIVNDLAAGARVCSMTAAFSLLLGGGTTPPADGASFVWAEDLADGAFGEDGTGGGLVVSFDTYDNTDSDPNNGVGEAPAVEVRFHGMPVATNFVSLDLLDTAGGYAQVVIRVESDGTLDLVYDNQVLFYDLRLPGFTGLTGARFGWGARTGGLNENHWLDNVQLTVGTSCPPRLSIDRDGSNVVVTFDGVLETATSVTGPWTELTGQTSPYVTTPTDPARFFRARSNP